MIHHWNTDIRLVYPNWTSHSFPVLKAKTFSQFEHLRNKSDKMEIFDVGPDLRFDFVIVQVK